MHISATQLRNEDCEPLTCRKRLLTQLVCVPRKWYQKIRDVLFRWQPGHTREGEDTAQTFERVIQNLGRAGDELEQRELLVRKREAEVSALQKQVRDLQRPHRLSLYCPCLK